MEDSEEYLLRLTLAIDELDGEIERLKMGLGDIGPVRGESQRKLPELTTRMADLRDFFLFLTLDALEDPDLAPEYVRGLVRKLELCERKSRSHGKFFFTLAQLLSLKHEIAEVPNELIDRGSFEASWRRTKERLGL